MATCMKTTVPKRRGTEPGWRAVLGPREIGKSSHYGERTGTKQAGLMGPDQTLRLSGWGLLGWAFRCLAHRVLQTQIKVKIGAVSFFPG